MNDLEITHKEAGKNGKKLYKPIVLGELVQNKHRFSLDKIPSIIFIIKPQKNPKPMILCVAFLPAN